MVKQFTTAVGGRIMILNEVKVDEYYTIDLPDHDRHKQVVRVVHDSYALGNVINRELCIVEDEENSRFIIKKIRLRKEREDVIELLYEHGAIGHTEIGHDPLP